MMDNITNSNLTNIDFCYQTTILYRKLNYDLRNGISASFIFTSFLGIAVNSLLVYLVKKTKQHENQSIRLLSYSSAINIMISCIGLAHVLQILYPSTIPCQLVISINFMKLFSLYSSGYFLALLGLDRYLRVRYLNNYENVFTLTRFHVAVFIYVLIAITLPALTTAINYHHGIFYAKKFTIPINITTFLVTMILYILSVNKLRCHIKGQKHISPTTSGIAKIIKIHLTIVATTQGFQVIFLQTFKDVFLSADENQIKIFVIICSYNLPSIVGIINAIIIIRVNDKIRTFLLRFVKPLPVTENSQ